MLLGYFTEEAYDKLLHDINIILRIIPLGRVAFYIFRKQ